MQIRKSVVTGLLVRYGILYNYCVCVPTTKLYGIWFKGHFKCQNIRLLSSVGYILGLLKKIFWSLSKIGCILVFSSKRAVQQMGLRAEQSATKDAMPCLYSTMTVSLIKTSVMHSSCLLRSFFLFELL